MRHLLSVTVTMTWPDLTVTAEPGLREVVPGESPSQRQTESIYRALCWAREEHNAPDDFPDIQVDTTWAESMQ